MCTCSRDGQRPIELSLEDSDTDVLLVQEKKKNISLFPIFKELGKVRKTLRERNRQSEKNISATFVTFV